MNLFNVVVFGAFLHLGASLVYGEETRAPQSPAIPRPLVGAVLAPALLEAAQRNHIDLSRTAQLGESPEVGDSVVFWIGTISGNSTQQWLLRITRAASTPEEQKAHQVKKVTHYMSWGEIITFESEVDALDLWLAGPVDTSAQPKRESEAAAPAKVSKARVFVPRDFLRLGLDDSERVSSHINRRAAEIAKEEPTFKPRHLYSLGNPIKSEKVALAKPIAERIGITPAQARSWAGGLVALHAFYDLAMEVPALNDIADIVCQKPSLWKLTKLASGTGFRTGFGGSGKAPVDSGKLGFLPVPMEVFDSPFSFSFGGDPIVHGAMLVTTPTPPLDVSAGIMAVIAIHPTDRTRVIEMRAMVTQKGPVGRPCLREEGREESPRRRQVGQRWPWLPR